MGWRVTAKVGASSPCVGKAGGERFGNKEHPHGTKTQVRASGEERATLEGPFKMSMMMRIKTRKPC